MNDTFDESLRRGFVAQNTAAVESDDKLAEACRLEKLHGVGNVWDTVGLQQYFEVHSFMAPFCIVTRKSDGKKGCVEFQDRPRFYFRFTPKS